MKFLKFIKIILKSFFVLQFYKQACRNQISLERLSLTHRDRETESTKWLQSWSMYNIICNFHRTLLFIRVSKLLLCDYNVSHISSEIVKSLLQFPHLQQQLVLVCATTFCNSMNSSCNADVINSSRAQIFIRSTSPVYFTAGDFPLTLFHLTVHL